MMPSVAELTYFIEVATLLNLSRAAKKLCISQPSLSRAMQQLEATIGTELLIRHSSGVTLTPAGKRLLLHIKPMLQHWHNTKIEALAANQDIVGRIKIGCPPTIGLFLHEFILTLLEKHPLLDIELSHAAPDSITQQVIDLNIDIGIVTNPIQCPDLIIRKVSEIETAFWVAPGNRPIQNINSDSSVIIYNPDSIYSKTMLQKCKNENINIKRVLKVNNLEVIANLTVHGCGIGLLPSCFSRSPYMNKLKRVTTMPMLNDSIYLIYRKEYLNIQAVKTAIETMKQLAKTKCVL